MAPKQSPTEDRVDLSEFGEDLPHSLPGNFRPPRFEEIVEQEVEAYRAFVKPLRKLRRKLFEILGVRDEKAARKQVEWSVIEQAQWDRAISEYLVEMQGSDSIPAAAETWYYSDAALPEQWRLGTEVGIDRATVLTGASEATLPALDYAGQQ